MMKYEKIYDSVFKSWLSYITMYTTHSRMLAIQYRKIICFTLNLKNIFVNILSEVFHARLNKITPSMQCDRFFRKRAVFSFASFY